MAETVEELKAKIALYTKGQITARVNSETKVCKHCGIEKSVSEYQKAGGGKWTQPYCKPCDSVRKRVHYEKNRKCEPRKILTDEEKRKINKDRATEYAARNREKILADKKEYYKKNISKFKEYNRIKRSNPQYKIKKAAQDKLYREQNHEKVKAKKKEYYDLKGNEQAKEWQKKQMGKPEFRIKKNLRSRVYVALKRGIKTATTMDLLGCTIEEFKIHIESQFKDGMGWHNYTKDVWHLDHIKPCKLFDLTKESEQRACFNFLNMQPLWSVDNLKKGIKYERD